MNTLEPPESGQQPDPMDERYWPPSDYEKFEWKADHALGPPRSVSTTVSWKLWPPQWTLMVNGVPYEAGDDSIPMRGVIMLEMVVAAGLAATIVAAVFWISQIFGLTPALSGLSTGGATLAFCTIIVFRWPALRSTLVASAHAPADPPTAPSSARDNKSKKNRRTRPPKKRR